MMCVCYDVCVFVCDDKNKVGDGLSLSLFCRELGCRTEDWAGRGKTSFKVTLSGDVRASHVQAGIGTTIIRSAEPELPITE
jgi:hypothetical protein